MSRITSFAPIIGGKPKVLILGSMPSVKSLEVQEYYGHGRNQFWRIMGDLFDFDRNEDYSLRKACVMENGIAIWDVLQSCEREGSLDKNIKNFAVNDVVGLIQAHPSIRVVILNGTKAREVYFKHFKQALPQVETVTLYSTSPANAIAYEKKLSQWQQILQFIKYE